jgi:DNA polymerase III subunit beta
MQTSFERDELLRALSLVAGVVERRQTLPILSYVVLNQDGNSATLTGTDLEIEVVAKVRALASGKAEVTLPARKLLDICRALPAGSTVELRREGEKVLVKAGRSRFSLVTLAASEFPRLEVAAGDVVLRVSQDELESALSQTQFCMAQQDVRYYLNGLLFEIRGEKLRFVGTDGHRMAVAEIGVRTEGKKDGQVIVPRKGVQEMIRLLQPGAEVVEIHIGGNHMQVRTENVVFSSKLIDGRYPDYNKVLPTGLGKRAELDREAFREALSRAAILSNEKYRGVRLEFSGKSLRISAHNPEQEEALEEIGVEYQGEPLEIGFNVSYMLDAVGALRGEKVQMGLNDPSASCLMTAPGQDYPQYVVMPMRL